MSRLPHQPIPSIPIEDNIPVCAVAQQLPVLSDFPTALQEGSPDPIVEVPIVHIDTLFNYQCLDPTTRRRSAARLFDPTWEYDHHGLLGQRLSFGEVQFYVPNALRTDGPCAIIVPFSGDGSDFAWG
jgi:hypothetical protein